MAEITWDLVDKDLIFSCLKSLTPESIVKLFNDLN